MHASLDNSDGAMQIDDSTSSTLPSLPTFLSSCISYTASPAALRVAIRHHLPEADDLVYVLEILEGWIARWNAVALKLFPTTVSKNPRGVLVAKPREAKRTDGPALGVVSSLLNFFALASFH